MGDNHLLPRVALEPLGLFGLNMFGLKLWARPPRFPVDKRQISLRKKLVSSIPQPVDVARLAIHAALNRPEAPIPVASRRYSVRFVVPTRTHWRGWVTSLRPYAGR